VLRASGPSSKPKIWIIPNENCRNPGIFNRL
jgi:hypothetical protein